MNRVRSILITIPSDLQIETLFSSMQNLSHTNGNAFESHLNRLSPQTVFQVSDVKTPYISFQTNLPIQQKVMNAGNLHIGFNLTEFTGAVTPAKQIYGLQLGPQKVTFISLQHVINALQGSTHVLNHAGFNIGPKLTPWKEYETFRTALAKYSNLYSYPTGEEWPFVIPSSDAEFTGRITDESTERNPKFELVYSHFHPDPLIQLDIQTSYSRNDIETLFPDPYGISLEGLEHVFRSIFVLTDWHGVLLRLDLRFYSGEKDFGYWIINEGNRL